MRHVDANSIRELRVFASVQELKKAARPVALEIRSHKPHEPVFLAILAGDGGFRGCFFPDDALHYQKLSELAQQTGLNVVQRVAEKYLIDEEQKENSKKA